MILASYDITNFMAWFIDIVVDWFGYIFTMLDSITFAGTSLLKVILFINVIVPFLSIIIVVADGSGTVGAERAISSTRNKIKKYNDHVRYNNQVDYMEAEFPEEGSYWESIR